LSCLRHIPDSTFVDSKCSLGLVLAEIDPMECRGIDDACRARACNQLLYTTLVANVDLLVGHGNHFMPFAGRRKLGLKVTGELAVRSDEQNLHLWQDNTSAQQKPLSCCHHWGFRRR